MAHRELPVRIEHELLLKLVAAGLTEPLAQMVIESRGNELAKKFVDSLAGQRTLTWAKAQELVGTENFFGPEQWARVFGIRLNPANIPEIPWSQSVLRKPGIKQEHFLFLGVDIFKNLLLNLKTWHQICPSTYHVKFEGDWYVNDKFAKGTCEPHWYLMPIGIVKGSLNLSYDSQKKLLPDEYEVPTAPARFTANVLYYLLNSGYLDVDFWARTSDRTDNNDTVDIVGDLDGLSVGPGRIFNDDVSGIAASRKRDFISAS